MTMPCRVFIVGAGPGDPELLTLKAHRLITTAGAVVFDRLVAPEILALIPPGAMQINVGKLPGQHRVPQEEINRLLVRLAQSGRTVVRLKGGDPYVFGRGSEEAIHLARSGVPFEVVPAVTSASGCAAAAGIPLTHRGVATGVRYVTGHCRGDAALDLNWNSLADPQTTLVVYMGLAQIAPIAAELIGHGLRADTPAVAISNGTLPRQRRVLATLGSIAERAQVLAGEGPVLFVIGQVVALAALLAPDDATAGIDGFREASHA